MIEIIIPAGYNQGVYDVMVENDWEFTILADYTHFDHGILPAIQPGESTCFELYSNTNRVAQNGVVASFRGPPPEFYCEPVIVDVPHLPKTLTADIDNSGEGDGIVDILDLSVLVSEWLTSGNYANLNDDDIVNLEDFSILASQWLATENWYMP